MKKQFLSFALGVIFAAAIPDHLHAQAAKDSAVYAKNNELLPATAAVADSHNAAGMNAINKKAVKSFTNTFKQADDVKWFTITDGFIAYCTVNGIRTRSHYDKKGNWLYSSQFYDEKQLPKTVRTMVKRTYYDYAISGVQEIHVEDKIVYLIYMSDEKSFETVRVCDDDMDILESFPKVL